MKILILFFVTFFFIKYLSAQNDTLNNLNFPLSYEASYIGDALNNLSGGIKKGSGYLGMANLKISFDTEKAKLWKGGQLLINGANTHGSTPSADLIGDLQGISNIEAGNLIYFHELWFKQTIGDLSLTVGLQDLNTEFISSENAGLFTNGSFGTHSTIADNVPAPIFPLTAIGAQIQYNISENVTGKVVVFDGFPDDFSSNPHNVKWKLKADEGLLTISEFIYSINLKNNLQGTYKFGGYYHNHYLEQTSESDSIIVKPDNYGLYLVADQFVFKKSNGKELSFFTQFSISPSSINSNWYYLGIGLNYRGLLKKRNNDLLGIAVAHAGIKNMTTGNETTIELTYKAQINENIFIQPDIQYVINPSGTDEKLNNALVAKLRFGLNF